MKSRLNSAWAIVVLSAALLFFSSCHALTTEPRAQRAADTGAREHGANSASTGGSNPKIETEIKLLPIDEGNDDPSFQEFRNHLLVAVRRHDHDFILRVVDPAIENGYDIEPGINEFNKRWTPEDPKSSFWEVLSAILTGGGSFTNRNGHKEFCGPYVVSKWSDVVQQLPKGTDSLDYVAITAEDVPVYSEPKLTAPVVAKLSYDVVRYVPNSQVLDQTTTDFWSWLKIKLPKGEEGYVTDKFVQGPMDHGACFTQTNGHWKMTELAARE